MSNVDSSLSTEVDIQTSLRVPFRKVSLWGSDDLVLSRLQVLSWFSCATDRVPVAVWNTVLPEEASSSFPRSISSSKRLSLWKRTRILILYSLRWRHEYVTSVICSNLGFVCFVTSLASVWHAWWVPLASAQPRTSRYEVAPTLPPVPVLKKTFEFLICLQALFPRVFTWTDFLFLSIRVSVICARE